MIVARGIPQSCRAQAAALYWEAFGPKLDVVMGPRARALEFIALALQDDHGFCAFDDNGQMTGLAGFKTAKGALVGGGFAAFRAVYGTAGAVWRMALLALLDREVENSRFLMDGLCVAEARRGQGVGTALLQAIYAEARARGYAQVRLDVVATNSRAKALYLQQGFQDAGTRRAGILRFIFGFSATTAMVRDV